MLALRKRRRPNMTYPSILDGKKIAPFSTSSNGGWEKAINKREGPDEWIREIRLLFQQ
jgi:hypothetical protein